LRTVVVVGRVLVGLALASAPLPAGATSFESALNTLLRTHPEIQLRRKNVVAAGEGIRRAYAGYLPRLDVNAEYGPQRIDSPVTRSAGGGDFSAIKQVAGVRLSERLFDGFATPSEVRTARLNQEVAQYTFEGVRQNVLFDGIAAYLEVLRQHRLTGLARDNEQTIRLQLNLEDERVKRGAGIAVDVLQAKSRLQIAKERRVAFEGGLRDAVARYVRLFGEAPEVVTMAAPAPAEHALPASIDACLKIAADENPAIDSSLATVEVAAERRRLARSEYYPVINLVAAANREKDNDLVEGTRKDYAVFLQATWNLFSGFRTNASVAQAAQDFKASQDHHELVRRAVLEQTRLAWNELETARERVELLENAVEIATEVFEARGKLREAGRETVINVLDAENELINARINLTQAATDRTIAFYRVLQGLGRLSRAELNLVDDD
jgi:adhesin transport system outer membrane protein